MIFWRISHKSSLFADLTICKLVPPYVMVGVSEKMVKVRKDP